jgi:hypothetical protein
MTPLLDAVKITHATRRAERESRVREVDHAAFGLRKTFSDGSPDFTDPHRPGFRFLDTKDSAKLAADTSYWEMVARLDYRHRQQDGDSDDGSRQRTLDELEAAAAASYAARSKRMAEAWWQR